MQSTTMGEPYEIYGKSKRISIDKENIGYARWSQR